MTRSLSTRSASLASACLLLILPTLTAAGDVLPHCQFMRDDTIPKYHLDDACDRVAHNSFGNRARRIQRSNELHGLPTGIQQVPNEETITCPMQAASLYPPNGVTNAHIGMHTSWLVENTSKLPVVLVYVDFHTGREYSAMNSNISPPHADPQAILMPHQWKSVRTMEGHVFHVYELLGTSPNNYQMGRLVMQHRVGLVPIRNRFASPEAVQCGDPTTLVDAPPIVDRVTQQIEPEFQRSPEIKNERCNVLYRGFRNTLGCPVHAFYIGQSQPPLADGQQQCAEDFKFHLGINSMATDFEHAWDAPTKFETTFISHSFIFRLASNTSVMLDTHTFEPTHVVDCPEQDAGVPLHARHVSEAVAESVVLPFGDKTRGMLHQPKVILQVMMMANSTRYETLNHNTTTTSSQHQKAHFDYYNTKHNVQNYNETTSSSSSLSHNRQTRHGQQPKQHRSKKQSSGSNVYMAGSITGSRVY